MTTLRRFVHRLIAFLSRRSPDERLEEEFALHLEEQAAANVRAGPIVAAQPVAVQVRQITPGYLATMKIAVLRGRDVLDGDSDVLLVSEQAAKIYWDRMTPSGAAPA